MKKFELSLPLIVEHIIIVLAIGYFFGFHAGDQAANQASAKTQAAVRDALKAVPAAHAEASVPKP